MSSASRWSSRWLNIRSIARTSPRAFALVMKAAPASTTGLIGVTVLSGLLPVAVLAATKPTVDAVAELLRQPEAQWADAILWIGVLAFLMLMIEAVAALSSWLRISQGELVSIHVRGVVQAQSSHVAMRFYDEPEYFDRLHRARDEAAERPLELIDGLAELARASVAIVGMAVVLAQYGWWLPLLLALAMLPALVTAFLHAARQHRFAIEATTDERRAYYFDWLLTDRAAAPEIRSLGLQTRFRDHYRRIREQIRVARVRMHAREALSRFMLALLGLGAAGGAVLWMLKRTVDGLASVGDVALCYQAFVQASSASGAAVAGLSSVYRNALFLEDFFMFLDLPGDKVERDHPARDEGAAGAGQAGSSPGEIEFRDVSFSYPGSGKRALDRCSLIVRPGEIVAILGANGAGKSTLVKLLCRFYDPDDGQILLAGKDIRALPVSELRAETSVMFQDCLDLSGQVADNVLPSDPDSDERIWAGLRAAHADGLVEGMPEGIRTRLSTMFPEGIELSGGEWQRLAMARAFAKPSPVLIFDEPTSAMDPWAERAWLQSLRAHARGRSVVLITHRLSTAAPADRVYVLERGRVRESGSHESLLQADGPYASLWRAGVP